MGVFINGCFEKSDVFIDMFLCVFSKPYSIHEIDPSHICPTYDCKFITYAIRGFVVIIA